MARLRLVTCLPSAPAVWPDGSPFPFAELDAAWRDDLRRHGNRWRELNRDSPVDDVALEAVIVGYERGDTDAVAGFDEEGWELRQEWFNPRRADAPEIENWRELVQRVGGHIEPSDDGETPTPDEVWVDVTFADGRLARAVTLAMTAQYTRWALSPPTRNSGGEGSPRLLRPLWVGTSHFVDEHESGAVKRELEECADLALPLACRLAAERFAETLDGRALLNVATALRADRPKGSALLADALCAADQVGRALRLLRLGEVTRTRRVFLENWGGAVDASERIRDLSDEILSAFVPVRDVVEALATSSDARRPHAGTPFVRDEWADLSTALAAVPILVGAGHAGLGLLLARETHVELGNSLVLRAGVAPATPGSARIDGWVNHFVQRVGDAKAHEGAPGNRLYVLRKEWNRLEELRKARNELAHGTPRRRVDNLGGGTRDHDEARSSLEGLESLARNLAPFRVDSQPEAEADDEANGATPNKKAEGWFDRALDFFHSIHQVDLGAPPLEPPAKAVLLLNAVSAIEPERLLIAHHVWASAPAEVRERLPGRPELVDIEPIQWEARAREKWARRLAGSVFRGFPDTAFIVIDAPLEVAVAAAHAVSFSGADVYYFERGVIDTSRPGPYALTGQWRPLWLSQWELPDPRVPAPKVS